ncbi:LysR family transcriptional regulator [Shimia marina]|uniref:LysR family transcriptional regulator n=1 Tax=Shimia marina TaxID=321267 RepID=UPI0008E19471|nr:LysR family transcriptional regulator [Shimia marina]SFE30627.1 DNA-binding transcriptional regulator, LysR family [Shimia marina]
MDWGDLKFFLAVARNGTLSAAAAGMRTTPSRVSRHVEALEQSLGYNLFRRSLDGYRLTDEGRSFVPRAEAVESAVHALDIDTSSEISGRVRIATTESIATHLLARPLCDLQKEHPNLQLELLTSSSAINLLAAEADVALRLVRPQAGNLAVQRLGRLAFAVYQDVKGVGGGRFVTWMADMADLPAAQWVERTDGIIVLRSNSLTVHHEMAAQGYGCAILPCFLGDLDPRLRRVGSVIDEIGQDLWLVINRDLAGSARVRCVSGAVANAVANQSKLIRGSK